MSQELQRHSLGRRRTVHGTTMLLLGPVLCVVTFVTLPLLAIFLKVLPQAGLWETLREPLVTQALRLSLVTSLSSLCLAVLFGTPVAYLPGASSLPRGASGGDAPRPADGVAAHGRWHRAADGLWAAWSPRTVAPGGRSPDQFFNYGGGPRPEFRLLAVLHPGSPGRVSEC